MRILRPRHRPLTDRYSRLIPAGGRPNVRVIRIVKSPVRAPKANAIAERFVRTVSTECLDRLLVLNRCHLESVLRVYVDHYDRERPHRALELRPPELDQQREKASARETRRRDRLGGLIHEYHRAAASAATPIVAPFRRARWAG
jgi:transposase InsO family protein